MWIVGEGRISEPSNLAILEGKWFILNILNCNINIVYLENGLSYKLHAGKCTNLKRTSP